ncbi:proprotein convertase P-domain-containing protein [Micromonospora lutea]|nr:proprotein convertase P-domain-containing protein [Micromonospora lutea]
MPAPTSPAPRRPTGGTWKLRIEDLFAGNSGVIEGWKLTL